MTDLSFHRQILAKILKDFCEDPDISGLVGFKGGTAAYMFYGLPRLSIDLDFDMIKPELPDTAFQKIGNILMKYGTIKDMHEKRYSFLWELSYRKNSPRLKVEINKRNFGSSFEIKYYLGIPLRVMVKKDIFANKLVAMYERECKANRDIFDVHYFLDNGWEINEDIIKVRTKLNTETIMKNLISLLKKKSASRILSGLGDLLDDDKKKWAKSNLIKDTIFLLNLYVKNRN